MTKQGVLYYADGAKYLAQAERSIASLKAVSPHVHVTLGTSEDIETMPGADAIMRFNLDDLPTPWIGRAYAMMKADYERVLYIDTDTLVIGDVSSIFETLDQFGLAVALAPLRRMPAEHWDQTLPEAYTGFNTGVLAANLTDPDTRAFLSAWAEDYLATFEECRNDQPAFSRQLYRSKVRFLTLPQEYNFRAEFANQAKGGGMPVKILHSHALNEMSPEKRGDIVRKLSLDGFATLMRDGDTFHVQTSRLPEADALPFVARTLPTSNLRQAVRNTHVWDKISDLRNLPAEIAAAIADAGPIQVLQVGRPVHAARTLMESDDATGAIVVQSLKELKSARSMFGSKANIRIIEAAYAEQPGHVTVARPRDTVPDNEILDPPTGLKRLNQRLFPDRRPENVKTRRPALPWPALLDAAGVDHPDVLALSTAGQDRDALEAYLALCAAGERPLPRLVLLTCSRLEQKDSRSLRATLRDAGYWVVALTDFGGILAVMPDALP